MPGFRLWGISNLAEAFLLVPLCLMVSGDLWARTPCQAAASEVAPQAPSAALTHVKLGQTYFSQNEELKAEAEFKKALELDPANGEAHLALGRLRLIERRYREAEEELRQAIHSSPESPAAYSALAQVLLAAGRAAEVRDLLEKAVALDPAGRDWQSRYRLAAVLNEAGEAARATALLQKIREERPEFLPAREQLALGLLRRRDLAGARREADILVATSPRSAEGHRVLALVLWKERQYETSLEECALALASDPDSASMLAVQSLDLWRLDRKKESRSVLVQLARSQPRLGTAEVFCRLVLCDGRDIGIIDDFLRKNRWALTPGPSPAKR